jgi:hypothetical protein
MTWYGEWLSRFLLDDAKAKAAGEGARAKSIILPISALIPEAYHPTPKTYHLTSKHLSPVA